MCNISIVYVS
jgi:hypothetical protein